MMVFLVLDHDQHACMSVLSLFLLVSDEIALLMLVCFWCDGESEPWAFQV